tara:strand:- start:298 stop:438 length:141 start_codon:yes stop_codon:yes gene_type:complete
VEDDSNKIIQDMIYEVRMLTGIVFLNFLVTIGIVGIVVGVYWFSSI